MYLRKSKPRDFRHRAGVAVVELAVCLPVLMLIVIATVEATEMIFVQQSLSIAAYEGARVSLTAGASEADVVAQCNLILTARDIEQCCVAVAPPNFDDAPAGSWISVRTSTPFASNSLMGGWLFGSKQLSASVEMMKEKTGS